MEVLRNGKFSEVLDFADLAKGLRRTENDPRNRPGFEDLNGLIGKDGNLVTLPVLTRLATTVITDAFPYPQIFNLRRYILVCGSTKIYEFDGTTMTLKITASVAGQTWSVLDYFDHIYLSNGSVVIIRDSQTNAYSESTSLPTALAACDYNGQAMLGGFGA
jgi:hypothetical protein